jgi:signal-transduction protein with cAMP-binding, CBS, and nucleotidyltransferase domain
MPTESTTPAQPGTLKRLLAGHPFFEDWDDDGFKSLAGVCQLLDYSEGERVLEAGDLSPFSGFLLEGQLELTPTEGQPRILEAGDLDAGFPFANLRPSCYDVVSCSDSSILQIETSRLKPAHKQGEARLPTARCSGVNRRWIQFRARCLAT